MSDEPIDFKRAFKASFFASLFSDKERGLELVNAIMDTNYPPDTDVTIETLSGVFFMGIKNDLALKVGGTVLFLGEHQSTVNRSITVRFVSYYGRVLESMIDRDLTYGPGILNLPRPVFVVLYNGVQPQPPRDILKLSASFKQPDTQLETDSFIELQVVVINIHAPENADLLKKSPHLMGYVEVVRRGREYQAKGLDARDALSSAIRDCVAEGILSGYLRKHAAEVIGMLTEEFKVEDFIKSWHAHWLAEGREEGRIEGRVEGRVEGRIEGRVEGWEKGRAEGIHLGAEKTKRDTVMRLRKAGADIDIIAIATNLSREEILRLE
ncbi:MAG: hypothetical protein LBH66_00760 [Oscillospiraceae bacterium]|nr:hypothetical protein [Oscillospiraceae bacterium]